MADQAPLNSVSDTAKWVAIYRAMETERPDALFKDPYARRLAGAQGQAIVDLLPKGRRMAWPMIVRTAVMDEIIMRAITRDKVDTVMNLAAGLDTRPYRLPLPPDLHWVDVDLPDMSKYKESALQGEKPVCRLEYSRVDLADAAMRADLFRRVAAGSKQTLVIAEGLLVYLEAGQVASLAKDLHGYAPFRWWLIDLASPALLKMMAKGWGKALEKGNAPFKFGPAEGTAFFAPLGWREVEYRSMWDESLRLDRSMPFARFWNFIGKLYPRKKREEMKRFSGMVLFERS
jgi:methyltransferase (TIGR00027 family)